MTLFDQITISSNIDDIDDAIRPIQQIIGQYDGGLADHFFERVRDSWATMRVNDRERWIVRYIAVELDCFNKMATA